MIENHNESDSYLSPEAVLVRRAVLVIVSLLVLVVLAFAARMAFGQDGAQRPATPQAESARTAAASVPAPSLPGPAPAAAMPTRLTPTETQQLRLEVAQRDARLAFLAAQDALRSYLALAEQIKRENGWPERAEFDQNTITFSLPPAPTPAPKPAKKGTPK